MIHSNPIAHAYPTPLETHARLAPKHLSLPNLLICANRWKLLDILWATPTMEHPYAISKVFPQKLSDCLPKGDRLFAQPLVLATTTQLSSIARQLTSNVFLP
jgi:hypothetical protein